MNTLARALSDLIQTAERISKYIGPNGVDKMTSLYSLVMDAKINPLKDLHPAQRFQIMLYLSMMWTVIFCAATGAWLWYEELVVAHVLFAFGFLVTGLTFNRARRLTTYRGQLLVKRSTR